MKLADLVVRRPDILDAPVVPTTPPAGTPVPGAGGGSVSQRPVPRNGYRVEEELCEVEPEARTGFLLRICLDLQIDALMLTLAEAARDAVARGAVPATRALAGSSMVQDAGAAPWCAWLKEDVEHIFALAADVVERGGALPAVLGSLVPRRSTRCALDALSAHYDVVQALLVRVRRDIACHRLSGGAGEPWVDRVLEHHRRRLEALRTPAPATAAGAVPSGHPREFLPGEFLG